MNDLNHLRGLPIFKSLDAEALERIAGGATEVSVPRATTVYRRGDACRSMYIVLIGQLKLVLQAPNGSEKVVEVVGPGGCCSESALVLGRPYMLTAETLKDSRLLQLPKALVLAEIDRRNAFSLSLIESLSARVQYLIGALEDCMVRSGTERVISYLLNQLPDDASDGRGMVTFHTKKGVVASQLNLTHEHFSRILRDLASGGLIEVEGRTVHLPDLTRLRARLEGSGNGR